MDEHAPLRLGVDARPLCHPFSGIGRYTREILLVLKQFTDLHLVLYGGAVDALGCVSTNVTFRPIPHPFRAKPLQPMWIAHKANNDDLNCFWSPRNHLPRLNPSIRTMVTIHDICSISHPQTMPRTRRIYDAYQMRKALQTADHVFTVSNTVAAEVCALLGSGIQHKITTHRPGSTLLHRGEQPSRRADYILSVGTLEPRKRYDRLFAAHTAVSDRLNPSPSLIVVGSYGWLARDEQRMLISLVAQGKAIWHRQISDHDLEKLYLKAGVVVSASDYEGFNLPICEALMSQTPVVATDIGAHREFAGPNLRLVARDSHAIALAIRETLTKKSNAQDAKSHAIDLAKSHSWLHCAEDIVAHARRIQMRA